MFLKDCGSSFMFLYTLNFTPHFIDGCSIVYLTTNIMPAGFNNKFASFCFSFFIFNVIILITWIFKNNFQTNWFGFAANFSFYNVFFLAISKMLSISLIVAS